MMKVNDDLFRVTPKKLGQTDLDCNDGKETMTILGELSLLKH